MFKALVVCCVGVAMCAQPLAWMAPELEEIVRDTDSVLQAGSKTWTSVETFIRSSNALERMIGRSGVRILRKGVACAIAMNNQGRRNLKNALTLASGGPPDLATRIVVALIAQVTLRAADTTAEIAAACRTGDARIAQQLGIESFLESQIKDLRRIVIRAKLILDGVGDLGISTTSSPRPAPASRASSLAMAEEIFVEPTEVGVVNLIPPFVKESAQLKRHKVFRLKRATLTVDFLVQQSAVALNTVAIPEPVPDDDDESGEETTYDASAEESPVPEWSVAVLTPPLLPHVMPAIDDLCISAHTVIGSVGTMTRQCVAARNAVPPSRPDLLAELECIQRAVTAMLAEASRLNEDANNIFEAAYPVSTWPHISYVTLRGPFPPHTL